MHHNHLRNLIIWMGLIIVSFSPLLLWDEVESLIDNFQSKKEVAKQVIHFAATQEPLYFEDLNSPKHDMHHLIRKQGDGEPSPLRVYPYSVVDGGVHSVQELGSAIRRDPVVAKHYSNFNLEGARVIEAKADRDFHVSYRIGEEIFWTKKRLRVVKGERLITDGTNFTRTRCANMLSEVPQGKTSPDEPTAEVFDAPLNPPSESTPFEPPVVIAELLNPPSEPILFTPSVVIGEPIDPPSESILFAPPVVIEQPPYPPSEPIPFKPPVIIGGPIDPLYPPSEPTPVRPPVVIEEPVNPVPNPVPEPATMLLLGSGLIGLAIYGRKQFFKK